MEKIINPNIKKCAYEEDIQLTDKHRQSCLTSLAVKEMQTNND